MIILPIVVSGTLRPTPRALLSKATVMIGLLYIAVPCEGQFRIGPTDRECLKILFFFLNVTCIV